MIRQSSPIRGLSLLFVGLLFVIPAVSELFPVTISEKNIERHGVVYEFSKQVDGVYGGTALAISKQRLQKRTDGLLIEELH